MNLHKAIELNEIMLVNFDPDLDEDEKDALQLGIEALKFARKARTHTFYVGPELLPGETRE